MTDFRAPEQSTERHLATVQQLYAGAVLDNAAKDAYIAELLDVIQRMQGVTDDKGN